MIEREVVQRIERLFTLPGLSTEARRKRSHVALGLVLFVPIFLIFGMEDFLAGSRLEGALIVGTGIYLLAFLIALLRIRDFIPGLRFAALLVFLLLGYEIWVGGGGGFAILWFYCFPIFMITLMGLREGVLWSVACLVLAAVFFLSPSNPTEGHAVLRFLVSYALVALFSYVIESSRQQVYGRLKKKKMALEDALHQVKTLRGLLPICTGCKNIRDDQGYWQQIEEYVARHSEAKFTHGLCQECIQEFYPEMAIASAATKPPVAGP